MLVLCHANNASIQSICWWSVHLPAWRSTMSQGKSDNEVARRSLHWNVGSLATRRTSVPKTTCGQSSKIELTSRSPQIVTNCILIHNTRMDCRQSQFDPETNILQGWKGYEEQGSTLSIDSFHVLNVFDNKCIWILWECLPLKHATNMEAANFTKHNILTKFNTFGIHCRVLLPTYRISIMEVQTSLFVLCVKDQQILMGLEQHVLTEFDSKILDSKFDSKMKYSYRYNFCSSGDFCSSLGKWLLTFHPPMSKQYN